MGKNSKSMKKIENGIGLQISNIGGMINSNFLANQKIIEVESTLSAIKTYYSNFCYTCNFIYCSNSNYYAKF